MNESISSTTTDTTNDFTEVSETEFNTQIERWSEEKAKANDTGKKRFTTDALTDLWLHDEELSLLWEAIIVAAAKKIPSDLLTYLNTINNLNLYLRRKFIFTAEEDVKEAVAQLAKLNGKISGNGSHTTAEIVYAINDFMKTLPRYLEAPISQFNNFLRFFFQEIFTDVTNKENITPNNTIAKKFIAQEKAKSVCPVDGNFTLQAKVSYLLAQPEAAEYFCANNDFLVALCQEPELLQEIFERGHMQNLDSLLENNLLDLLFSKLPYFKADLLNTILQKRLHFPHVLTPNNEEMQISTNPAIARIRQDGWIHKIAEPDKDQLTRDARRGNKRDGAVLIDGHKYYCEDHEISAKYAEFIQFIQEKLTVDRPTAEHIAISYSQGLQSVINALDGATDGLPFNKTIQSNIHCHNGKIYFTVDVSDLSQKTFTGKSIVDINVPGKARVNFVLEKEGFRLVNIETTTLLLKEMMTSNGKIKLSPELLSKAAAENSAWEQPNSSKENSFSGTASNITTPDTATIKIATKYWADRHKHNAEPLATLLTHYAAVTPLWNKIKQAAAARKPNKLLKALRAFYLTAQRYLPQENKIPLSFWREAITEIFGEMPAADKRYCLGLAGNLMTAQDVGWFRLWQNIGKQINTNEHQKSVKEELSTLAAILGHDSSSNRKLHLYHVGKTKPIDNFVSSLIALKILRSKLSIVGVNITHQKMRTLLKEYHRTCGSHLSIDDAVNLMNEFPQTATFFLQRTNALERRLNNGAPSRNYRAKICKRPDLFDTLIKAKDPKIYEAIIKTKLLKSSHLSTELRSQFPTQADMADEKKLQAAFTEVNEALKSNTITLHKFAMDLMNTKNSKEKLSQNFLGLYEACAKVLAQFQIYKEQFENYRKKYFSLEQKFINAQKNDRHLSDACEKLINQLRNFEEILKEKIELKLIQHAQHIRLDNQSKEYDTEEDKALRARLLIEGVANYVGQVQPAISSSLHQSEQPSSLKWIANPILREALIAKFSSYGSQLIPETELKNMINMLNDALANSQIKTPNDYMLFIKNNTPSNPAWSVFNIDAKNLQKALQSSNATSHKVATKEEIGTNTTMQHNPAIAARA